MKKKEIKVGGGVGERSKNFIDVLKRGFKVNENVLNTYIYDVFLYIFLVLGFFIFSILLGKVMAGLDTIDYNSLLSSDINAVNPQYQILRDVFTKMIGVIIFFLIYSLLIFSYFKGLIWNRLLEKKLSFNYYKKTVLMNLIFEILFVPSVLLLVGGLKAPNTLFILIPVFMHFNALSYYFFTKENKVFKGIWKGIKFSFVKIHKYILHYAVIIAFFVIASYIIKIILKIINLRLGISSIINVLALVFIISILRNYFVGVMKNAEQN